MKLLFMVKSLWRWWWRVINDDDDNYRDDDDNDDDDVIIYHQRWCWWWRAIGGEEYECENISLVWFWLRLLQWNLHHNHSWHLIVWGRLPEDPIVFSLISREEAKPQFCIGRVSQAFVAMASEIRRCVISVRPPTPPCCRRRFQGASVAVIFIGDPAHTSDCFPTGGVQL